MGENLDTKTDTATTVRSPTQYHPGKTRPAATSEKFRRRPPAQHRLRWVLLAAFLLIIVVAVAVWRMLPERVVATAVTHRDVARTLVLTGRVRPAARPQVGTTIGGTVSRVLVREGDHVSRGQLLLQINDAQAAASLAQAKAALATSAARTRSNVEQATMSAASARRDAERARILFAQGAISQRERDEAERAAANAAAELSAAGARDGGAATLAEISRARAAVASAEAVLAFTSVRSPASAVVLTRTVDPGDAVLPGQVLMELGIDGATELIAFAREENLADLKIGSPAIASADAFPDRTFAARVSWIAPVVDPRQGTVEVRFTVPNPPSYLRADMTVSINVEVERRAGALVVSRSDVGDINTSAPWVMIDREGKAMRQPVKLGIIGNRDAEILGGLAENDRVLPSSTSPGARVNVSASVSSAIKSR